MTSVSSNFEQSIRERAYQIWEEQGRPDGRADEHWQQAKAELGAVAVKLEAPRVQQIVSRERPTANRNTQSELKVESKSAAETVPRTIDSRRILVADESRGWKLTPILPAVCWLALWGSINTGPWDISLDNIQSGWVGAFNGIRAAFPLAVLAIWFLHLLGRKTPRMRKPTPPEALWLFYAAVSLIATLGIEGWFVFAYWGLAFMATLACVEMYLVECDDEVQGAAALNRLSWVIATVILLIVVKAAGGNLVEETGQGLSGYGVNVKMPEVAGMPMVRSTGISRFAGAIGIVAFVAMWSGGKWTRLGSLVLFGFCSWLIWVMQGRGSTVSFVGAIGVMLVLLGGRARTLGAVVIAMAVVAVGLGYLSHDSVAHVWRFASRDDRHLLQMHGRLGIYDSVWHAFWESPLIGFGPQADRRVTFANAQNGFLYALLCGGIIGGGAWIAGFAVSLVYLVRLAIRSEVIPPRDSALFVQIAGLLVFFLLRTIPENTAALFSVDLMLQLPAMVYLGALMRARNRPEHDPASCFAVIGEDTRAAKAANALATLH